MNKVYTNDEFSFKKAKESFPDSEIIYIDKNDKHIQSLIKKDRSIGITSFKFYKKPTRPIPYIKYVNASNNSKHISLFT